MKRSVFFGSLILFLLVLPSNLAAKKYDLDDLRIWAEVQLDGRLRVVEDITYDFDGRFRYAFRTIPAGRSCQSRPSDHPRGEDSKGRLVRKQGEA